MSEDKLTKDYNNNSEVKHAPDIEKTEIDQDNEVVDTKSEFTTNEAFEVHETEVEEESVSGQTVVSKDVHGDASKDKEAETASVNNLADRGNEEIETTSNDSEKLKQNSKFNKYKVVRILCAIGFILFMALFINEVIIEPIRIKRSTDLTRELYNRPTAAPTGTVSAVITAVPEVTQAVQATPTPDPNRDEQGRLLQFKDLLHTNSDVKGWITIPDTNIDYVVMQSGKDDPQYYLTKDIKKDYSKAGSLFLDIRSSVEDNTQNYVIHGHNMVSTHEKMFHYLLQYKKLSYYQKHPVITFDTIYNTGKWKIFAVFVTNGTNKKDPLFEFRQSTFANSSEFLNFVYQIRMRSVLNIDTVDVNENDQLLTLSTCSYEVDNNYRTVVVARKIREGEKASVDVGSAVINLNPLYPKQWYKKNGGEAPKTSTFEDAFAAGNIKWYHSVESDIK